VVSRAVGIGPVTEIAIKAYELINLEGNYVGIAARPLSLVALIAVGQNCRRLLALLLLVAFALFSNLAYAHAILVEASPSANSTVAGPSTLIKLRFNVRIDAKRSRLELVGPDKTSTLLSATQPSPDTLQAVAEGLKAGAYSLRWQVLAADGHITRGEIPFNVKS
jgi:methionine-rich copper-binding protein CopC